MDLSKLLDNEDVSDPACMDKIYAYVSDQRAEDQSFVDCLISKLDLMVISWEQPWYQITRCLTRPLAKNMEEKELYQTDRFCKEEIDMIIKNWKKFRKEYDVPDTPSCLAKYKSAAKGRMPNTPQEMVRHFVISYLARGLKRTLHQVYRQFLSIYSYVKSGTFSSLEIKVIQIVTDHCPHDEAGPLLTYLLCRDPRQIYNKIADYSNKTVKKTYPEFGLWNLKKASWLLNLMLKETGQKLQDLKDRQFDRDVWLKAEEELQYPKEYIKNFWYRKLHVQIFTQKDLKLRKIQRRIFKKLRNYPYKVWDDIRWNELVKEFPDGCTPLFLYYVAVGIFDKFRQYRKLPLEEVIQYALEKIPHKRNFRLKRLALNEKGKLEPIYTNINEAKDQ